jgi:hypothetical protein
VTPAQGTLDGKNALDVTLTVITGQTVASVKPLKVGGGWPAGLLCLTPWLWLEVARWRKKGLRRGGVWRVGIVLWMVLGFASAMSLMGCGVKASGGTSSTGTGGTGSGTTQTTPSGSYPITLTATMPGVQKTIQVTLTVE